tara:strand:- start:282 stop:1820 length:1539 start_codon:yes stop_codon:yes gene_type:complete
MGAKKIIPLIGILGVGGLAAHYYSRMDVEKNTSPLRNTSFAPKTPEELAEIEAVKAEAIAQYKENNEEPIDIWNEYLPAVYEGNRFEDFINDGVDEEDNPFKPNGRIVKGANDWITTSELKLIDYDWDDGSGGAKLKIKKGYEIVLKIRTDNAHYFNDDVFADNDSDYSLYEYAKELSHKHQKGGNWDSTSSYVSVPMVGHLGDYISIDIDEEYKGIRGFRVQTNGRKFSNDSGESPDDGVYLTLEQVNKENDNYCPTCFSAESVSFNAPNVGVIRRLWGGISGLVSALPVVRRFGKASKAGAIIGETTFKVGDKVGDSGMVAKDGYKLTEGMLSSGDPSDLKYVKSFDEGTGLSKLDEGVALRKADGRVVGFKGVGVKIQKGDELIKLADVGASGGSGIGNAITLRNYGRATLATATVATIYVIGSVAQLIPGLLGDGFEDLSCSLTGSCCEERCEDSDNPDCVAECQEAADDKAVKFGGLVVLGIVGLVLVLKGGKSKKSAEEFYVVQKV